MDATILAVVATVLGLAFALPGAILSMIVLKERLNHQHQGNNRERQK